MASVDGAGVSGRRVPAAAGSAAPPAVVPSAASTAATEASTGPGGELANYAAVPSVERGRGPLGTNNPIVSVAVDVDSTTAAVETGSTGPVPLPSAGVRRPAGASARCEASAAALAEEEAVGDRGGHDEHGGEKYLE